MDFISTWGFPICMNSINGSIPASYILIVTPEYVLRVSTLFCFLSCVFGFNPCCVVDGVSLCDVCFWLL